MTVRTGMGEAAEDRATLGDWAAMALVFGSSAAVLVIELTALRLLAPYLGLTLETNTLVIGVALAAIALGSWSGGKFADTMDPRRVLGPLLAISGAVVAVTPVVVRSTGAAAPELTFLIAALAIIVPGSLLAAVTPMVTKLCLVTLAETGSVVGRLSGIGTLGAIVGTVVTGFVLISRLGVSTILIGLGLLLIVGAVAVQLLLRRPRGTGVPAAAGAVLVGALGASVAPGGCDVETTYHCAVVVADPARESGRALVLDGLRHSYVDQSDPTYLEFAYIKAIASVTDVAFEQGKPVRAYHLGAGGLTIPRYLHAVRPGTTNVVSEIDPGVVRLDRERLGLRPEVAQVRIEDGRIGVSQMPAASQDLIVGDAFGGVSAPWHLATREAIAEVHRVLKPDGVYAANLIDHGSLAFARAEAATLSEAFTYVAVLAETADVQVPIAGDGGNLVALASDRELDLPAIQALLDQRETGWSVISGDQVAAWIGDAQVLRDDFAPVDQLMQPYA